MTSDFIDGATFNNDNVPLDGDMPDISMAYPWSADVFANPDHPNGAVWPYRLIFGSETDPEKAKVSDWVLVDDLCGLSKLWAGTYSGKIFFSAQNEAPAAAEDTDEAGGAPIADGYSVWKNGQPVLPFRPVPMEARDGMLKNESGLWRALDWEPMAVFDVVPTKSIFNSEGQSAIERYTLFCIVDGSWVAFFSSKKLVRELYNAHVESAPAVWPYSYWLSRYRYDGIKSRNEIKYIDANDCDYQDIRFSPLPWQKENEKGREEDGEMTAEGVLNGEFYSFAPAFPTPRYFPNIMREFLGNTLGNGFQELYLQSNGEFKHATKEAAFEYIVKRPCKTFTQNYSVDPGLHEEIGRVYAINTLDSVYWYSNENEANVIFSLHLDATDAQWAHWLACFGAVTPTGLILGSAGSFYNDFPEHEPGPGTPNSPALPDDAENTPPSAEDPASPVPDDSGGSGGSGPGPSNDPPTNDDTTSKPVQLPQGYFYTAGKGVTIKREWVSKINGWKFYIHVDDIVDVGSLIGEISLVVSTQNDVLTYNIPKDEYEGVNMYYGVSTSENEIFVTWKSSASRAGPHAVADTLAKKATAKKEVSADYQFSAEFEDSIVYSDDSPSFFGSLFKLTKTRSFDKRGTCKIWDSFEQKWRRVRYVRNFEEYSIEVDEQKIKAFVAASARDPRVSCSTWFIKGRSDDLDGPLLSVESCSGRIKNKPTTLVSAGKMKPEISLRYSFNDEINFNVSGRNTQWTGTEPNPKNGSINGNITLTVS